MDAAALAAGAAAPPAHCVNVTNTGAVTSDVSVLAFVSSGAADEPLQELYAFGRLAGVAPGETRALSLVGDARVLASGRAPQGAAPDALPGALFLYPGAYTVTVGDTRASGNYASAQLAVRGGAPVRLPS